MGSKGIEQSPLAGPSNPVKPLAIYETALKRELQQLVQQREQRRLVHNETEPLSQAELSQLVDESLARLPAYEGAGEVVKTILEKALERVVLELVRTGRKQNEPRSSYIASCSPSFCRSHGKTTMRISSSTTTCSTSFWLSKSVNSSTLL